MAQELINPCGIVAHADASLAERRAIGAGTVVGLSCNGKANAHAFLDNVRALLDARFEGIEFLHYSKNASVPADFSHEFLNRCHAVVAAFGD